MRRAAAVRATLQYRGSGVPCQPPFIGGTAVGIKEQITTDLAAASVTVATYLPGYTSSDCSPIGKIVFTVVQTFTVRRTGAAGPHGGPRVWKTRCWPRG